MALEEFYAACGGDYAGVKGRLLTDERITKFLGIYFADPTYESLITSLAEQDLQTAFRAAHTMKGTSRDLGLTQIADAATELADALRPDDEGNPHDLGSVSSLVERVNDAFAKLEEAKPLLS